MNYLIHYFLTGRIYSISSLLINEVPVIADSDNTLQYIIVNEPIPFNDTYYIKDNLVIKKEILNLNNITLSVNEEYTFEDILPGAYFEVYGERHIVNDTSLTISFDSPGSYILKLSLIDYLEKDIGILVK